MSQDDQFFKRIIELVDAKPFQPFGIRMRDGRTYRVDAREYFARSRGGDVITYYTPDDRLVTIRVAQINSLEIADRPGASDG